jgi:hypothetical protein
MKIETILTTSILYTFGMDISTVERELRRAQRKYNRAIHQLDGDADVVMREAETPRPTKPTPMDDVEETPVILPTPLKVGTFWVLVNGFYTPMQLHYA